MTEIPYHMRFTFCDNYYPQSRITWDAEDAILYTELFAEKRRVGLNATMEADNITQLCFDLSVSYEVMYIECVGFRFTTDNNLIAPTLSRRGNLVLSNPPARCDEENQETNSPLLETYSLGHALELTTAKDGALLRIGIDTKSITEVIAASPHLLYTLSNNALQEIWIVDPNGQ